MVSGVPLWLVLLAFVGVLGPLVFFHELGHYLVGRWFGVGAEVFSIGFGREVVGWTDKRGTRWKVAWLPLGGYVRFVGDMNPASAPADPTDVPAELRAQSFHCKPVWQRFLIVLAGPLTDFILAILIFAAFFIAFGAPRTPNVVSQMLPQSAAQQGGLKTGDRLISIAGRDTPTFEDISQVVMLRPNELVDVEVERAGERTTIPIRIAQEVQQDRFGQTFRIGRLGIYGGQPRYVQLPAWEVVPAATVYTWRLTRGMVDGLWQIISGRRSVQELGGPMKIAQVAGQQASLGWLAFIQLIALISINLGFINLLPVPMLDGGHLLFYGIEAVRRRPVSPRTLDWAFRGGLSAILALLIFTTVNDLGSFGLWDGLGSLIG